MEICEKKGGNVDQDVAQASGASLAAPDADRGKGEELLFFPRIPPLPTNQVGVTSRLWRRSEYINGEPLLEYQLRKREMQIKAHQQ